MCVAEFSLKTGMENISAHPTRQFFNLDESECGKLLSYSILMLSLVYGSHLIDFMV